MDSPQRVANSQTDTDGDADDDLFIDENASPLHNEQSQASSNSMIDIDNNNEEDMHEKILLLEAQNAIVEAKANISGFESLKQSRNEQETSSQSPNEESQSSEQVSTQEQQNHELKETNLQLQKQLQQEQQLREQQQRRIFELEREVQQLKILLRDREDNQDKIRMCLQKEHLIELNRKENIFKMNLALKEQELQDALRQIEALKQQRIPTSTTLESYLLDPALNFMFEKMRKEVEDSKSRVEEMQNDLNAWKFTPDSATGKRLMAKCSQLHQENEELGRMISSGKIAKLESTLAMHEKNSLEDKCKQAEIEDALLDMEEDIDALQNTVYFLQQQLKDEKELNKELSLKCKNLTNDTPSVTVEQTES